MSCVLVVSAFNDSLSHPQANLVPVPLIRAWNRVLSEYGKQMQNLNGC